MLVSNVLVIDPVLGIRKTNIGIKDGIIVGVGRAGNPDVVDDVELVLDAHTALVPGEGLIATPGTVDSHVHLSSPGAARRRAVRGRDHAGRDGPGRRVGRGRQPRAQLRPHDRRLARRAAQHRLSRARQRQPSGAAGTRARLRRRRVQGARGLRRLSRDHRQLPLGRPGGRRSGRAAHGHPERGGPAGRHPRRHRRPHRARLPHRGKRRRASPAARVRRRAACHRLLDHAHDPVRRQHARRARCRWR